MLSSNVALISGNSTKPGSGYYALIKAVCVYQTSILRDREACNTAVAWQSRSLSKPIPEAVLGHMRKEKEDSEEEKVKEREKKRKKKRKERKKGTNKTIN